MKERTISALVVSLIFIPFLIIGGIYFQVFVTILSILAFKELMELHTKVSKYVIFLGFFLLVPLTLLKADLINNFLIFYLIFLFLIMFCSIIFIENINEYNYKDALIIIGEILFIGLAFNSFIYFQEKDVYLLIYLFLITISNDTFAYIVGSSLGKRKLSKLSPNKTIEGAIGGLILGTIIPCIYAKVFLLNSGMILILETVLLSIVGQIGDLAMSSVKREHNIKNFSNLIKGHGGILDRFDSIIFVMLAFRLLELL